MEPASQLADGSTAVDTYRLALVAEDNALGLRLHAWQELGQSRLQGLRAVGDEIAQIGDESARCRFAPVDVAVGVRQVPGVLRVATLLAEVDATRVAVEDGQVLRVARATHHGRRQVTLDRLHGELHTIGGPQPDTELTGPLSDLWTPARVEGRRERVDVEPANGDRLRSRTRIRDDSPPEKLIAEEWHHDRGQPGAEAGGRGSGSAVVADSP